MIEEMLRVGPSGARGMTLIELLMVLALVAILASLAIGSYRDHVLRTNRSDAIRDLLHIASCQERIFRAEYRYDNSAGRCIPPTGQTGNGRYSLTLSIAVNGQGFTVTATPLGSQSEDLCGTMSLDEREVRNASGASNQHQVVQCWRGRRI